MPDTTKIGDMAEQYSPAVNYLSDLINRRERVRENWKHDAPDLVDAQQLAFSALASMITRFAARKIDEPARDVEGQICLIAQFLIGVELCETAISEGLYSQAAALLKQQL
jgi:hypothetical protein